MRGKQETRWGDAGMGNSPGCTRVPARAACLEQQGKLDAGCAGGVKHPTGPFCFPVAPEDPRAGVRAGGAGGAGGGCLGACCGDRVCSLQGLVLSFGVSVSAQLLPFNTRYGHCAHKILTWSRTMKDTKFGELLAFLIVGSIKEEVVG